VNRIRRTALVIVVVMLAGLLGLPAKLVPVELVAAIGPVSAMAQAAKPKKRRSLFSILFGRSSSKKKKARDANAAKKNGRSKNSRGGARKVAPVIKAIEKNPDAKVVLVVGDFFASGLADGLTSALSQVATLRVVDKTKGLSGFVRTDIVDWPAELLVLIDETRPSYIVAMLGSNDRQALRQDGIRLKKLTPEWFQAYAGRVDGLAKVIKSTNLPYAWVGLPPVRFKTMNKDFLAFNELYSKAAQSRTGQFIDIWDGFSDADGNYSRSGPDVNGQIVLLRAKDGINLTRAGKRRLAYYVEGIISKLFGGGGSAGLDGAGFDFESYTINSLQYDPATSRKTIVVRLNDPSADGGDVLAGEVVEFSAAPVPALFVPVDGKAVTTAYQYGRVDNFIWPPQDAQSAVPPVQAAQTGSESPQAQPSDMGRNWTDFINGSP
jgi:hypothetical protein